MSIGDYIRLYKVLQDILLMLKLAYKITRF